MKKFFIFCLILFIFVVSIFSIATTNIFGASSLSPKPPLTKTSMPTPLTCSLTGIPNLIAGKANSWTGTVVGGNPPYNAQWQYTGSEISLGPKHQMLKLTEVFIHAFGTKGQETIRFTVTDNAGTIVCAYFSCIIEK